MPSEEVLGNVCRHLLLLLFFDYHDGWGVLLVVWVANTIVLI